MQYWDKNDGHLQGNKAIKQISWEQRQQIPCIRPHMFVGKQCF